MVPPPVERHQLVRPQPAEHIDLLLDPHAPVGELLVERLVLHPVAADTHAEAQPAPGEQVELGRLLGDEDGLTLRQDQDAGHQFEPVGHRTEVAEQDERLVVGDVVGVHLLTGGPVGVATDDVLGDEQMVEPGFLDGLGELLVEARVGPEVRVTERDPELHSEMNVTSPSRSNNAATVSPGANGLALMNDPERITWPASGTTPNSWSLFASQATALIGLPMTADATPLCSTLPLIDRLAPIRRMSTSVSRAGQPPRTTRPHAAASEMLSTSEFGPRLFCRTSTTSRHGSTKSVARITSTAFTPGPTSGSRSTKASSASTRGRFIWLRGTTPPSTTNQSSNSVP